MRVEFKIVPGRTEPTVVVEAPSLTPQAEALIRHISALEDPEPLLGRQGEKAVLLDPAAILRFYTDGKGVLAQGEDGATYAVKSRLYELEGRLDPRSFVRISHSEIVNLKQIDALDLTLAGTIRMTLRGGVVCYVSRRYVKRIKQALGLCAPSGNG